MNDQVVPFSAPSFSPFLVGPFILMLFHPSLSIKCRTIWVWWNTLEAEVLCNSGPYLLPIRRGSVHDVERLSTGLLRMQTSEDVEAGKDF
jgi:hypothetical protein